MADAEAVAEVSVAISKASLDALSKVIGKAIDAGMKQGMVGFGKKLAGALSKAGLDKLQKDFAASSKKMADQFDRIGTRGKQSLQGLTRGMVETNKETLRLTRAMDALGQSQETIQRALAKSEADYRTLVKRMNQETIERTRIVDRAGQAEIETARNVAKVQANEVLVAGQKATVAARFAGQQRVQITRAAIENIARLERGLAATIAGVARTAVAATSRIFGALTPAFGRGGNVSSTAFTSSVKRMNSELNRDLTTSLTRREKTLQSSFTRQEMMLSRSAQRQAATIEKLRRQTSTGVLGAATGRGIGPGLGTLGAGVGVGALLTAGFTRFSELERLNKQFLALTQNAEKAAFLMAQVKEFAKLTPFDLVGVAGLAKGFLAIGTAAEDVMPQVKAIADAVALTGGGVEQLDRIQRAIGQVVSTGKLQGDELNQLAENLPGLNIRKLLADQLTGGDVARLVEMQAAGEISGEAFVDGLITGLQQDERLVGASEDLAKTLSGRVANLKESFADLGASIIGLFAGQIKGAVFGLQAVFQGLSDFIKGENLSEALETLRVTLTGVAVGMTAIGALKGNLEVFALMGRAVSLLLTPFGLLATAAGLIGGAIALMAAESVPFRAALEALGERFSELGGQVREFAAERLQGLAAFITETVIPALTHFADWLGANLVSGFDRVAAFIDGTILPVMGRLADAVGRGVMIAWRATSTFITTVAIPALQTFVSFLTAVVFPVVADLGRWVGDRFTAALGAVQRFGQRIRPYLQPAIDGFKVFASAVSDALGGDFSTLGSAAITALRGVATAISSLFDRALEALRPIGKRLLDWLGSLFTEENLIRAWGGILDAVEWLAEQIGRIVTHPAFVTAVAAIAAAAVQLGFRLVKGLVEGVMQGLPRLWDFIYDEVIEELPKALLPIALVGTLGALAFSVFSKMGASAGGGFVTGLTGAIKGTAGFAGALATGAGPTLARNSQTLLGSLTREAAMLQNQLRILGSSTTGGPSAIKAMTTELERLKGAFTPAQIRALEFRDKIAGVFRAIGTAITGAGGVLSGITQLGKALGTVLLRPLTDSVRGIGNIIGSILMPKDFQAAGRTAGQTFSQAWAQGITQIKTSWATMMADIRKNAAAQGSSVGKEFGKSVATGAALAFGGFVAGRAEGAAGGSGFLSALGIGLTGAALGTPILGAVAGGVALIGAAMGKSAKDAEDAENRIRDYTDAILNDLTPALEDGTTAVIDFTTALSDPEGDPLKLLKDRIKGIIPELEKAGITWDDIVAAFKAGGETFDALVSDLRATADTGTGSQFLRDLGGTEEVERVKETFEELAVAIQAARLEWDFFGSGPLGKTPVGIDPRGRGVGLAADEQAREKAAMIDWGLIADKMKIAWKEGLPKATDWNEVVDMMTRLWELNIGGPQRAADESRAFFRELGRIDGAWVNLSAIKPPPGVGQSEEDARDAEQAFIDLGVAIQNALNPPTVGGTTSDLVRDLILGLRGAGAALNLDGLFDDLELSALKDDLVAKLGPIFQQAIDEGFPITADTFAPLRNQLATALVEGIEDPVQKANILAEINKILDDIQATITANPITFNSNLNVDEQGQISTGSWFPKVEVPKITAADVTIDTAGIKAKTKTEGDAIGFNLMDGIRLGIQRGAAAARKAVALAAAGLAEDARLGLQITSPSKVFIEIGENVMAGLVIGIEDSAAQVQSAMVDAINSAIDKSIDAAKGGATLLRTVGTTLFEAFIGPSAFLGGGIGGGSSLGLSAGWTKAIQGFMDNVSSTASKAFDVALKKFEGTPLTPGETNIFGESAFSLNVADVLGAENVEALTGVLDQIVSFGSEMIAAGQPVSEVVERIKSWRDQLIFTSGALGFNTDEVRLLIDALGLSDTALADFVLGLDTVTTAAEAAALAAKNAATNMPTGTPGGMNMDEATRLRSLMLQALTLSPEDLEVFVRENQLGQDFVLNLQSQQQRLRNDLSHDDILEFGRIHGLWGSSLTSFVADIEEWLAGFASTVDEMPDQSTKDTQDDSGSPSFPNDGKGPVVLPRPPINVNIYPPYGDPLTIGLASANAVNQVAMAATLPGRG